MNEEAHGWPLLMPAPKNPNTVPATETVRRRGQETAAAKLREAGWIVIPPERATEAYAIGVLLGGREDCIELAADPSDTLDDAVSTAKDMRARDRIAGGAEKYRVYSLIPEQDVD